MIVSEAGIELYNSLAAALTDPGVPELRTLRLFFCNFIILNCKLKFAIHLINIVK